MNERNDTIQNIWLKNEYKNVDDTAENLESKLNELRPEDQEEKHIDTLEHSGIKYQKLWKMADPSIYVRNVDLEISKETK